MTSDKETLYRLMGRLKKQMARTTSLPRMVSLTRRWMKLLGRLRRARAA